MTLAMLKEGQSATIRRVRGAPGAVQRLAGMGILPGRDLTVVRNWGPVIVRVRDDRFVVGRGMVHHILVEPKP
jgi:Fe2+ transport system protein FeoA